MLIECDARLQAGWDEARVTHSVKGKRMSLAVPLEMRLSGVPHNQDAGLLGHFSAARRTAPIENFGNQLKATFTRFAELNLRSSSFCNETFFCC